jgi:hypothetical protein
MVFVVLSDAEELKRDAWARGAREHLKRALCAEWDEGEARLAARAAVKRARRFMFIVFCLQHFAYF